MNHVADQLTGDARYRARLLQTLRSGQYRDFERYWNFDQDAWFRKHIEEIDRRKVLLSTLAEYAPFDGARVLIVGSGFGAECIAAALAGARVAGIDLEFGMLAFATHRAGRYGAGVHFARMNALRPAFPDDTFDWVFLRQIVEHVPGPSQTALLRSTAALVRDGGHLFVDTPNHWDPIDRHDTGLPIVHWLPKWARIRVARLFGRDVPTFEPSANGAYVGAHDFVGLTQLDRMLGRQWERRSRYKEFPSLTSYRRTRAAAGRSTGWLKLSALGLLDRTVGLGRCSPIRAVYRRSRASV